MIKLYPGKTYVLNNQKIAPNDVQMLLHEDEARKNTLTYQILKSHNKSGDMKNLDIYFDSIGVYDNTYVGIMQTARASGLKTFAIPCIFTNCHNCLNAVGGTINADVHKYATSACQKYGGIYVPPHEAVIHQYMREMVVNCGDMSIVSDSHTRYGAMGSLSIGEGGPELVKTMIGKGYSLKYPQVIGVFLKGTPDPWVGPMDVILSIISKVFKNKFVKDAVLEFIGPGIRNLSMDYRNGIDTMTTESACLSSIWITDENTREYYAVHGRESGYMELKPGNVVMYDKLIEVDLNTIVPVIALPFHPSNVYSLDDVINDPVTALDIIDSNAKKVFENNKNLHWDLSSKVKNGRLFVDQAIVAGCCAGSFENIYTIGKIAEHIDKGAGTFNFNIYPASQPIMTALINIGTISKLMDYGVRIKTACCGPCFGAGDTPGNNDFSIRHSTRNFPNREGSNPGTGQFACVGLMDSRSIAATAFNGGKLTNARDVWENFDMPKYYFNDKIYKNTVYNGFNKAKPEVELIYGPDIKDWPEMSPLSENLLLKVASVIRDDVTTTDELIPSGETASYRSNPEKISQFTLIRKDPNYVGIAKAVRDYERARLSRDETKVREYYKVLNKIGISKNIKELMDTTGIGSVLYAKQPGDGSAREYAASCQKVLGGFANICIEYATKRYRSNCVNWGILPFTNPEKETTLAVGEYIYLPDIKKHIMEGCTEINATVIGLKDETRQMVLYLNGLTKEEKKILLAGSLINSYKNK